MEHGIRSHLKFLQGAISTGRNYELYNVLRGGDWTRQVYSYACDLFDIVAGSHDSSAECKPYHEVDKKTCQSLLEGRLDAGYRLNKEERIIAATCIVHDSSRLENIYYGFEETDLSAKKITAIRQKLRFDPSPAMDSI